MMSAEELIVALGLPNGCRVDQRVPKKLLIENGASTSADRRLINDGIEEIHWIAALKPTTVGVADYRDEVREYLEIAVLKVNMHIPEGRRATLSRLVELLHRAIPYPVFLVVQAEALLMVSLSHKRWAQNEAGKVVLDGELVSVSWPRDTPSDLAQHAFLKALLLGSLPQYSLFSVYQGWMDSIQALLAARLTGSYSAVKSTEQAAVRRQALEDCERLEAEASRLRAQAAKERQMARQVDLNMKLKGVQSRLDAARKLL